MVISSSSNHVHSKAFAPSSLIFSKFHLEWFFKCTGWASENKTRSISYKWHLGKNWSDSLIFISRETSCAPIIITICSISCHFHPLSEVKCNTSIVNGNRGQAISHLKCHQYVFSAFFWNLMQWLSKKRKLAFIRFLTLQGGWWKSKYAHYLTIFFLSHVFYRKVHQDGRISQ